MKYGITLVSHVEEIAHGLPKLLKQVAQEVPITFAGGTSDGDVAFYDLGSSKMNLELASEMTAKKIHLYDTAFIEGAYTAATLLQANVALPEIEKQLEELKIK